MREITTIIIHCSASPRNNDTIEDCDQWHVERGFKRDDTYRKAFNPHLAAVGYHYWISTSGVYSGRQVGEVGAHCSGKNSKSIGICMAGNGKYTAAQWVDLRLLIGKLLITYPKAKVVGHRDCPTGIAQGKTCPNFDVAEWMNNDRAPLPANVT